MEQLLQELMEGKEHFRILRREKLMWVFWKMMMNQEDHKLMRMDIKMLQEKLG